MSWAPLLADDKQNFHVLCIINPSLPLFMPTRPLSPAHAWIAKESALQLELIDILRKKKRGGKNWKSLSLSRRFLNGLISLQSQPSKAGRQAEQIESISMFAELGPECWNILAQFSLKSENYHSFTSHEILFYARNIQETFLKCLLMLDNISNFQHFARLWYDMIGMPASVEYYMYP